MRAKHIFGDLLDRVPQSTLEQLAQVQKDTSDKFDNAMQQLVMANMEDAERRCMRKRVVADFSMTMVEQLDEVLFKTPMRRDATSYCRCHGTRCKVNDPDDAEGAALTLVVAGSTCTDECPFGPRKGLCGKAGLPFT